MKLPRAAENLTLYILYSFFIPWRNVPSSLAFKTLAWSHVYVFRTSVLVSCMCVLRSFSHAWLFVMLWTVAWQASFSMGFSRQEYWCGFPCHSSRDPPNPGIESCVCRIAIASFTTDHQESPKLCVQFSSVQSLSRVWPFATPWIAARQASLSTTNSQSSLRLTSIESVMPSHPLSSPSPPAPNPSQHQSLFQWVNSLHEVSKVLELQL